MKNVTSYFLQDENKDKKGEKMSFHQLQMNGIAKPEASGR